MRTIGYARVSTREQSLNSQALDQQIARLVPHADEVWSDVESGKNDLRKNFKKLEKLIKSNEKITVVVTRLDRLSRRLVTLKKFIDLVTEKGCGIKALDNQIDTSSAVGKFHISLLGALAEMESDQISERVKHGLDYLIKNGKAYHGPFGYVAKNYIFVYDTAPFFYSFNLKKELSKYDVALMIVHQYLKLKSLHAVSRWLKEMFDLKMSIQTLSRWLKNPVLSGHLYFPSTRKYFYNQHQSLTDQESLERVSDLLKVNARFKGYTKRCLYSLSGLIYCRCGAKATVFTRTYIYVGCSLYGQCPIKIKPKTCKYLDLESEVFRQISSEALRLSLLIDLSPKKNHRINQLQLELSQLEAISSPHKSVLLAITEITTEIESERLNDSYLDKSGDRQLFIDTFSSPDFWEFFQTKPLETRQSLLRKFIKKIVFNPFAIEFNL